MLERYDNINGQCVDIQFIHLIVLRDKLEVPSHQKLFLSTTAFQRANLLQRQDHPQQSFRVLSVGHDNSFKTLVFLKPYRKARASGGLVVNKGFFPEGAEQVLHQWWNGTSVDTRIRILIVSSGVTLWKGTSSHLP